MAFFSNAVKAMLNGAIVRETRGVELQFASGTMRLWPGNAALSHGGHTWLGIGTHGSVSALQIGPGAATEKVEFTLSGVDATIAAKLDDQANEVYGRRLKIWMMFFNADWSALDTPYCLRTLVMDRLEAEFDMNARTALVKLSAEPLLSAKHFPPHGYLTPHDQQARAAGDKGLERMPLYSDYRTTPWGL